jgi:hypothetical protein
MKVMQPVEQNNMIWTRNWGTSYPITCDNISGTI